uniref:Uncharacterized protein n=1 Tax=Oryza sativa subsp. japonica TaxID=39947 RepID=Q7F1D2_ORYSJ|nr:hypothetical protein [Oryza sativa Japonica Group]BAD03877.1 hypothetical protein [Oryza sativa Japonica Group]
MTKFSYPGLLTALQYLTSVAGVWTLAKLGLLYHDPFNFQTAKKSLTPLLVAIADDTAFRIQEAAMSFQAYNFVPCDYFRSKENNLCHGFHSNRRVVNKFLTVAINVMIWDKHASSIGLVCLLFTLAGGVLYQQSVTTKWNSPLPREAVAKQGNADNDTAELDEEKQKLGIGCFKIFIIISHRKLKRGVFYYLWDSLALLHQDTAVMVNHFHVRKSQARRVS